MFKVFTINANEYVEFSLETENKMLALEAAETANRRFNRSKTIVMKDNEIIAKFHHN